MRNMSKENIQGISGGRFVEPTADMILPPTRTYQIQGGRFVQPTANRILPRVRHADIQLGIESGEGNRYHMQSGDTNLYHMQGIGIDYENSYHFGAQIGCTGPGRRRDE